MKQKGCYDREYAYALDEMMKEQAIDGRLLAEDLIEWMPTEMLDQFVDDYNYTPVIQEYQKRKADELKLTDEDMKIINNTKKGTK